VQIAPQNFDIRSIQLETEFLGKTVDIVLHLSIENLGRIPVNLRQIGIQHHLDPANRVYPRLQEIFVYQGKIGLFDRLGRIRRIFWQHFLYLHLYLRLPTSKKGRLKQS